LAGIIVMLAALAGFWHLPGRERAVTGWGSQGNGAAWPVERLFLTALQLAPLAALHAGRILPEVPNFGKLRALTAMDDWITSKQERDTWI